MNKFYTITTLLLLAATSQFNTMQAQPTQQEWDELQEKVDALTVRVDALEEKSEARKQAREKIKAQFAGRRHGVPGKFAGRHKYKCKGGRCKRVSGRKFNRLQNKRGFTCTGDVCKATESAE